MLESKKLIAFYLTISLFSGCRSIEIAREMKITLSNESGLEVSRAAIVFYVTKVSGYRGDSIAVRSIAAGKSIDVFYNLEHIESFYELSPEVNITFKNSTNKDLKLRLPLIDSRRYNHGHLVIIKSDTLTRRFIRK